MSEQWTYYLWVATRLVFGSAIVLGVAILLGADYG